MTSETTSYAYEIMKDLQGFFKHGQRLAIYNNCKSNRDRLIIRLLWKSGRRVGEVIQVRVKEIDFETNNILWHIEKKREKIGNLSSKKAIYKKKDLVRWKPQDKVTMDMVKDYIKEMDLWPEQYLFQSPKGVEYHLTRQMVYHIVKEAADKAGIYFVGTKKPHPHHFRHSFIIDKAKGLKSPADIRKLQMIAEHSNLGMTEQYLQFGNEDMRDMMEMDDGEEDDK